MKKMSERIEKGALERVRDTRHQISEQFNHDPKKLIEYYINLQEKYKDRFLESEEKKKDKQIA